MKKAVKMLPGNEAVTQSDERSKGIYVFMPSAE
jgi:hypothetical protein